MSTAVDLTNSKPSGTAIRLLQVGAHQVGYLVGRLRISCVLWSDFVCHDACMHSADQLADKALHAYNVLTKLVEYSFMTSALALCC